VSGGYGALKWLEEPMQFYGLKTCDTCRKAASALRAAGQMPEIYDVRGDGVPPAVLEAALTRFGATMVNRRSTTWRDLSEAERQEEAATLLSRYPVLMKRPLIAEGDDMTLGWDAAAQAKWLG